MLETRSYTKFYSEFRPYYEFRPHRFAQNVNGFAQKCISVLKAAKSDTKPFAALLLVTHISSFERDGWPRTKAAHV